MPHWTDVTGLSNLLDQRGREIAALTSRLTALEATCAALAARLAALETPGPPPVIPHKP